MAFTKPPADMVLSPAVWRLPHGAIIWRVHRDAYDSCSFNSRPSHQYFNGARFDGTKDDSYAFLYAGCSPPAALAETLVRNISASDDGLFHILRRNLDQRMLSPLVTCRDSQLIDLRQEQGIREVMQDSWLVTAPETEYAQTRHWGHWIRRNCPAVEGFVWRSKRHINEDSVVLFGDRCGLDLLAPASTPNPIALDNRAGIEFINRALESIRCIVEM